MIAELGHFSLVLALLVSMLMSIYPLWGAHTGNQMYMAMARPLSVGLFLFTAIAFACLTYSFVTDDFTLSYVAHNSNSLLPIQYKYTAVWGGHEGSFLLWVLMFSGWTFAVSLFSKAIPQEMVARVLGILGVVAVGFYLFIIIASNPFESLLPFYPVDGRDLNPLLQDIGMIIHPPMLYMGYVGFSVAFAFALAALLSGQLDSVWARWARPWTQAAWAFLSIGIALGSWWAYYELGWGGWWFWDPVENASFMPWLIGTALLHSLAVTEKRKLFKSWTILLAIAAFSLSLLGTFLVRSGILISVHSFASDPERGLFILALLVTVIGGSLLLYGLRASQLKSVGRYGLVSREVMLFGNNVLLSAATLVVLLGTLLPLVHKELGMGSISIGEPFFNQMFTVLIVPFAFLMGVGPLSRWKKQNLVDLRNQLVMAFIIAILGALAINYSYDSLATITLLGSFLSIWIAVSTIFEILQRTGNQFSLSSLGKLSRSHWGMVLGHLGFAISIMGIAVTSHFTTEMEVRMSEGETVALSGYNFTFKGIVSIEGQNYSGHAGIVDIHKDGDFVSSLRAEKRFYSVQRSTMTEAGIDSNLSRDLFVALGEQLKDGSWALRLYVKPLVTWIWIGAFIMAFGAFLSMADKRYRLSKFATRKKAVLDNNAVPQGVPQQ
ncbi:heme lyase CcmF/NrfE family subunit [Alteromonas sp. a30]|uniref:heme lyase CcmF/NrfE family subunit n=1 Tax=Alteromonas sp. a30 TaxID=2730917 RepID=UPI002281941D|nr:heme lyase CcmF/NrfE family subunit [Alteromonas sp. a30]MCY7294400.1 heme lyase CcmF/NrfE family subunit [Alteromonas sp. a30]